MLLKASPLGCAGVLLIAACGTTPAPYRAENGPGEVDGEVVAYDDAGDEVDATSAQQLTAMEVLPAQFIVEDMPLRMLTEGDALDLWRAPQGGHVVLVAAKVRHFPSTAAALRVRVWSPATGILIAEEKRTVAMVPVPDEPDTAQPDLRSRSQVSHVPLCPNYDPDAIVDRELEVEVQMTALYTDPPQQAAARVHLVPRCNQEAATEQELCRCECGASYTLGKCKPDAGIAPADAQVRDLTDNGAP